MWYFLTGSIIRIEKSKEGINKETYLVKCQLFKQCYRFSKVQLAVHIQTGLNWEICQGSLARPVCMKA